jgi:hypothetical protein
MSAAAALLDRFSTGIRPAGRTMGETATGGDMDEIYRMLAREHQADLERDAERWRLGVEVSGLGRASPELGSERDRGWKWTVRRGLRRVRLASQG